MQRSLLPGIVLLAFAVLSMSAQDLVVDVNLRMIDAVVEDAGGRPILSLTEDDFEVLENGEPKPVKHLSIETEPIVVGLVVDRSASVKPVITDIDKAVASVLETLRPDDQVFLMTFAGTGQLSARLTTSQKNILAALRKAKSGFGTRFYDVVADSIEYVSNSSFERRLLIVFSDGADHYSTHTFEQVLKKARFAEVPIYFFGYPGDDSRTSSVAGRLQIRREFEQLAMWSGGRSFFPANPGESSKFAKQILRTMQYWYRLGYYSSERFEGLADVEVKVRRQGMLCIRRGIWSRSCHEPNEVFLRT